VAATRLGIGPRIEEVLSSSLKQLQLEINRVQCLIPLSAIREETVSDWRIDEEKT
jgi:hypothetical protein